MNLTCGFPVAFISFAIDLVGHEQLDALGPDLLGLAHRHPDIGMDEVDARDGAFASSVMVSLAPYFGSRSRAILTKSSSGQSTSARRCARPCPSGSRRSSANGPC